MTLYSSIHAHQVFLNYRGEQLRYSFVSHLIDAFEKNKINFFLDKYKQRGQRPQKSFHKDLRAEDRAGHIFSTRYTESSWCMNGLVKMKKLADKRQLNLNQVASSASIVLMSEGAYLYHRTMTIFSSIQTSQVFLNYRGEQLRYSFVSHLIDAFKRNEINFFLDKYEQRGKDLKNLFVRIQESRIALAIFSTRYTESSWCMNELVRMKKLADKRKLYIIPVFYKVKAEDVREQRGEFGDNFWTLAKVSSGDQIKKWKEALECVSGKMGLSLGDNSSEADFVKEIVKAVQRVVIEIGLEEEDNHIGNKKRKDCKCSCACELPNYKRSKSKKL